MKKISIFLLIISLNFVNANEDFLDGFENEFEVKKEISYECDLIRPYNNFMTKTNDFMYMNIFNPISNVYKTVVKKPERKVISNFFYHWQYPVRVLNNIVQLKFSQAYEETQVFLINSTLGFLGLEDTAQKYLGFKSYDEDLGQTLGFYGVPSGCHVVLPFLGPSNFRDALSYTTSLVYFDQLQPLSHLSEGMYRKIAPIDIFNKLPEQLQMYEKVRLDALELYPYYRDAYEQRRNAQINR